LPNTKYKKFAKFYSCWIWGATWWCGGKCHHLGRHKWSQSDGQKGSKVAQAYPQNRKGWRTLQDAKSPVTGCKRYSLVSYTGYHRSPKVPPARGSWQSPVDRAMWAFLRPSENCVFSKTRSVSVKENRGDEERERERERERRESDRERASTRASVQRSGEGVEDSVQSPLCLYKALCFLLILKFQSRYLCAPISSFFKFWGLCLESLILWRKLLGGYNFCWRLSK
jgi:hypothetical protein